MITLDFNFVSGNETISAFKTINDTNSKPACLLLHGAGLSDKERLRTLSYSLGEKGISNMSFDFSGHGKSTNNSPQSIRKRVLESMTAFDLLDKEMPTILCAFSMSGQVALNLIQEYNDSIKYLILFAPALYDTKALNLEFGPEFSDVIRKEQSWRNNNANDTLLNFKGKILIFMSTNDRIIPPEIPNIILNSAISCEKKVVYYLNDAPHQLAQWTSTNLENANLISNIIYDFINE